MIQNSSLYIFKLRFKIVDVISKFNLKLILSNKRTTIYENDQMRLCNDGNNIIRVQLFDNSNKKLLEELREYFYGKDYVEITETKEKVKVKDNYRNIGEY